MNGQPLGRNTIRLIVILMILFGATQTLLHQWGYGAEVPDGGDARGNAPVKLPDAAAERFVPGPLRGSPATLEMRGESTIQGNEIRLKQVCRWSNSDAAAFTQVGELVIGHFEGRTPFHTTSLDEVRQILHDAGVNLAVIRFAGPTQCTVSRSDVVFDEGTALDQWIDARGKPDKVAAPAPAMPAASQREVVATAAVHSTPTELAASAATKAEAAADATPVHMLKELLVADLSVRLAIPADELQVNFNPADQKLLSLSEPTFKFNISAHFIHNLGDVQWDVLVVTDTGTKKASINAQARAWQKQVVMLRALDDHQVFQPTDVTERRTLVDRKADEQLLTLSQLVGQQSARSLKPGDVLTARMVAAVPLAKAGQFVTVTLQQGGVRIKTVVRAIEGGCYGQSIRVRNEATQDTYEVTLTGPQEAVLGSLPASPAAGPGGAKVASVLDN